MGFFSNLFSNGSDDQKSTSNDPTDELRKIRIETKGKEELLKTIDRIKNGDAYGSWLIGGYYESGSMLTLGGSVAFPKNIDKARFWKLKSAEDGCGLAQYNISRMFYYGDDISDSLFKKDYEQSLKWLTLASDNNDYNSLAALGEMYYTGEGAPLDYTKAFGLFSKSVNHPMAKQFGLYNDKSALRIGEMYARGRGVEKNIVEGYKWIRITGCDPNEYYAYPLKGKLSVSEKAEAEALVKEWRDRKNT